MLKNIIFFRFYFQFGLMARVCQLPHRCPWINRPRLLKMRTACSPYAIRRCIRLSPMAWPWVVIASSAAMSTTTRHRRRWPRRRVPHSRSYRRRHWLSHPSAAAAAAATLQIHQQLQLRPPISHTFPVAQPVAAAAATAAVAAVVALSTRTTISVLAAQTFPWAVLVVWWVMRPSLPVQSRRRNVCPPLVAS